MSLEELRQNQLYLTEQVNNLEAVVLTLKNTVDAMSVILYHREPPKAEVTKDNVLESFKKIEKKLKELQQK